MDEGQIRRFQPLIISGGSITQKVSGTALKLLGADADILLLGDATHEGGDIKIYRDGSANLQLSVDADAASNTIALDIYGGVVLQNFLTVGQTTLNTTYRFYCAELARFGSVVQIDDHLYLAPGAKLKGYTNAATLQVDIPVDSPDSGVHSIAFQIDSSDVFVAQATGDGSGGITNKAVGLYGTTPATQAAHIADPAENAAANNAAIDAILVALENIGILASA